MKRIFIVICILCFLGGSSYGQLWKTKRYEAVAGIGTTSFFGDIGGFSQTENILGLKDLSFLQTRFNIGGSLRYRITQNFSTRLSLYSGMFHATDRRGSNEEREMAANTTFFEPDLIAEFCFIKSQMENSYLFSKGRRTRFRSIISSLDIYAFGGIGGLAYSVKGNEELVAHGMKNGGFTAVIPAGIGVNLLITPDYNLGLELGGRYSFSDYLDGYTSQYSRANDVYYFFNVTFTYKLLTGRNGLPAFLSGRRF